MSIQKVGAIGFLVFTGLVLTVISTFTKAWVVLSVSKGGYKFSQGGGIVPYSSDELTWAAVASWMMFISVGLYVVLFLIYVHAAWKVHHHGCCHGIRHSFHGVALLSLLIAIMEITAFVLMAINVPNSESDEGVTASLSMGYSEYLALTSAILLLIASGLSGHVSHHDCC